MKLKVQRREAKMTGHINVRTEGSGDGKKTAGDITISFFGTKRDIDNFVPMMDSKKKFSDLIYDQSGQLLGPHISPMKIHRNPDSLIVKIYDRKSPLTFKGVRGKNITIELLPKRNCEISMQLQLHPGAGQFDRLSKILTEKIEIEIEGEQEDLFNVDGDEDGGSDEAQLELDHEDEDEDEDEDEEEEE